MSDTFEITGTLEVVLDKAILVDAGLEEAVWIPRSLIENITEVKLVKGSTVELELPVWFLEEKGLV